MVALAFMACVSVTEPGPVSSTWPPKTALPTDIDVVFIAEEALSDAPPGPVYVTDKEMERTDKAVFIKMVGTHPFRGLRHDEGWTPEEVEMLHATLKANGHRLDCELPEG